MNQTNASSPRLSIVLPTYNGARYLRESLDSCLRQTFTDFELIVVDDGSTDETQAVLGQYDDPRLRVHRDEVNRGLPGALNTGFALARGELLTWTSDDNRFHPRALHAMVRALDANESVGLVYADHVRIDPEGRCLGRWRAGRPEHLVRFNAIGPCFVFRRDVWTRVGGFDTSVVLAEDYDFWIRTWRSGVRFLHLGEVLYEYRLHPDSLGERAGGGRVSTVQREVRDKHFPRWRVWLDQVQARLLRLWNRLFNRRAHLRDRQLGRTVPLDGPSTFVDGPRPLGNRLRQALRRPYYWGLARLTGQLPPGRAVILLYHSVADSPSPLTVRIGAFERQLAHLQRHFDIVPLSELDAWRRGGSRTMRSRPLAALTFDDGYLDSFEVVRPILLRLGLPATFYVTVSLIGSYSPPAWGPPLPMLSWSHLETMVSEGFEIGGHTLTHPDLTTLTAAAVDHEIGASRQILEERLGCAITSFAYPAGRHAAMTVERVRAAGFRTAVTTVPGVVTAGVEPLQLPRVGIGRVVEQPHFEALVSRAVETPLLMRL